MIRDEKNSVTISRESEDRSGYSLKYEAYDPNQENNAASKVISSDSYKKWGHLNFSKEDTSKNTITEGASVNQSSSLAKKSMEDGKLIMYSNANKSPVSIVNYETASVEK